MADAVGMAATINMPTSRITDQKRPCETLELRMIRHTLPQIEQPRACGTRLLINYLL
jgi:hypothetical protein